MYSSHVYLVAALLALATFVSGCSRGTNYTPAVAADPALARQTLTNVLDSWKSGASSQALAEATPQVYVGDEDWSVGNTLKNYEVIGEGETFGNSIRFQVGLEVSSKNGRSMRKTARYIVVTNPVQSVTRDDQEDQYKSPVQTVSRAVQSEQID